LETTSYDANRKAELKNLFDTEIGEGNEGVMMPEYDEVKGFTKNEFYTTDEFKPDNVAWDVFKHNRMILSRHDKFKVNIGPVVKAIEEVVFDDPTFIKKVPIRERPRVILERLGSVGPYMVSDFSSFEAHFSTDIMKCCQFVLIDHMIGHSRPDIATLYKQVLGGTNKLHGKVFNANLVGKRMSGEMDTSLANGFSNMMLMKFTACMLNGENFDDENLCVGFVEGDDGLFKFNGKSPSKEDFESINFDCKLEVHENISTTSFCGLLFHEDHPDEVIANPVKHILKFGFADKKYLGVSPSMRMGLLRSKALSGAYCYEKCPILFDFFEKALHFTRGVNVRKSIVTGMNAYERSVYDWAVQSGCENRKFGTSYDSRLMMERKFGISLDDQLEIENAMRITKHGIFCAPLHVYIPESYIYFGMFYSTRNHSLTFHLGEFTDTNLAIGMELDVMPRTRSKIFEGSQNQYGNTNGRMTNLTGFFLVLVGVILGPNKSQKTTAKSKKAARPSGQKPRPRQSEGNAQKRAQGVKARLSSCAALYGRSLVNPFREGPFGACVPDDNVLPSKKLKCFSRGTTVVGTAGYGQLFVVPLNLANDVTLGYGSQASWAGAALASSGTGVTTLFRNGPYPVADLGNDGVQMRVVSCGIRLRYTGTELNKGGTIYTLEHPNHGSLAGMNEIAIAAYPTARTYPVTRSWISVTYAPVRAIELEYRTGAATASAFLAMLIVSEPGNTFEFEVYQNFEATGEVESQTKSESDIVGFASARTAVTKVDKTLPSLAAERSMLAQMMYEVADSSSALGGVPGMVGSLSKIAMKSFGV
jgi:hypothetical protein